MFGVNRGEMVMQEDNLAKGTVDVVPGLGYLALERETVTLCQGVPFGGERGKCD